ncbi:HlyD family efflux transporter periplasmic adaptor subunit, partial [Mycobacterium tuberculosis]|nr:HlyD family efflux transporter periplasmic adaptor subunit [Mycobacterium tuberculosis]
EVAQANAAALGRRIDAERLRVNRLAGAALNAHANGLVWSIAAADGETVQRGQTVFQLVDCDAAFVTLSVSESVYNRLNLWQSARFR